MEANIPVLGVGEPGFCTDTYKLFIGSAAGNKGVAMLASPIFSGDVTVGQSLVLPAAQVEGSAYAVKEGTANLIRTFRPTGSDGYNIFIGPAGNITLGPGGGDTYLASHNIGMGWQALNALTTGYGNVAIGRRSMYVATTAKGNVGVGFDALNSVTTGYDNVGVGADALNIITTGYNNVAVGLQAMGHLTVGYENVGVGYKALQKTIGGYHNTAVGSNSLVEVTSGYRNTAVGKDALYCVTTGAQNVALGHQAGYWETGSLKLFIDNTTRASEEDGRIKALIYGVFAALTANQRLSVNARLLVRECPNYANNTAALAGGLVSGELYTVTGTDPLQVARVI